MDGEYKDRAVVLVGKVNLDILASLPEVSELEDAKFTATGGTSYVAGGAVSNVARALGVLSRVFENPTNTELVTRLGQCPDRAQFKKLGEYLLAKNAPEALHALLKEDQIRLVDVAANSEGVILTNPVLGYKDGRCIAKQKSSFVDKFNAANQGAVSEAKPVIENAVSRAKYVFIDPSQPFLGALAVDAAKEKKVPVVLDYGRDSWPSDTVEAGYLDKILKGADVIIVPDDAIVEGMKYKDRDDLFLRLQEQYEVPTIIMSNSTRPVRVLHRDEESEIPVQKVRGNVHALGVGDTRDAALLFFLLQGDDVRIAAQKATALATIKVQYPGNEWESHILEHIQDNPLFAKDIERLKNIRSENTVSPDTANITADDHKHIL